MAAEAAGIRVVTTRSGIVLSRTGGALGRLLPLVRLGRRRPARARAAVVELDHPGGRGPRHAVPAARRRGDRPGQPDRAAAGAPGRAGQRPGPGGPPARASCRRPRSRCGSCSGEMADEMILASQRVLPGTAGPGRLRLHPRRRRRRGVLGHARRLSLSRSAATRQPGRTGQLERAPSVGPARAVGHDGAGPVDHVVRRGAVGDVERGALRAAGRRARRSARSAGAARGSAGPRHAAGPGWLVRRARRSTRARRSAPGPDRRGGRRPRTARRVSGGDDAPSQAATGRRCRRRLPVGAGLRARRRPARRPDAPGRRGRAADAGGPDAGPRAGDRQPGPSLDRSRTGAGDHEPATATRHSRGGRWRRLGGRHDRGSGG